MNHLFWEKIRQPHGAILVEVLISLLIFTVGIVSAFSVLIFTVQLNSVSQNRIIALNLAQEGLEVVKNIRDTNWLVYSANMRECWNFSPDLNENGEIEDSETCTPTAGQNDHAIGVLEDGSTRIRALIADFDTDNFRWMLLPAAKYLDTADQTLKNYATPNLNGEAEVGGSAGDINISNFGNRNIELYVTPQGRYTHFPTGNTLSLFRRIIEICYIDALGSSECTDTNGLYPANASLDNRIKITSKVYWKEKETDTIYKSVIIETIMTDYLNRTEWIS